ncbi:unnamed protein product [Cuscuta campestris]|uniref:CCHC-type domain-containing protein n=1 Tax=Cuscuta campestris TaxID=132261 RepID=A0A484LIU8_9ASTE|nr:unnamed protein product [Cuscuta campestris]
MASRMFNARVNEGQSTTRPPLFDGTNYSYWKERMRIFIQSNDYKLWLIVKNGCGVPMKKVGEVNVPKTEEEFTDEDCKKMELNAKPINMIYCGVNADDYRKISRCETAKQMWEKLEVTYEGTAQVREAKIDHLTHEYELFSMKENEKIEEMFERFSNIINPLNLLGKTYTDRELVVEERNKRSIALPTTTSTHNNVDDEDDDSDDTDLGLFVRKFKKMMLKKGAKKNTPPKFYGCGEIGHIKPMCPKLKNEKDKKAPKKQRAYISWENDGSGSEDSETEEVANLCLMAIEDGDTSKERNKKSLGIGFVVLVVILDVHGIAVDRVLKVNLVGGGGRSVGVVVLILAFKVLAENGAVEGRRDVVDASEERRHVGDVGVATSRPSSPKRCVAAIPGAEDPGEDVEEEALLRWGRVDYRRAAVVDEVGDPELLNDHRLIVEDPIIATVRRDVVTADGQPYDPSKGRLINLYVVEIDATADGVPVTSEI